MSVKDQLPEKAREIMSNPALMDMIDKASQKAAYATSGATVVAGLTVTEWGVVVGAIGTLITVAFNIWFNMKYRRGRREDEDE